MIRVLLVGLIPFIAGYLWHPVLHPTPPVTTCGTEENAKLYLAIHEANTLHCYYLPTAEAYGRILRRKTIKKEK